MLRRAVKKVIEITRSNPTAQVEIVHLGIPFDWINPAMRGAGMDKQDNIS